MNSLNVLPRSRVAATHNCSSTIDPISRVLPELTACICTSQSLPADVVRKTYGPEFLIGVSTHSLDEARAARVGGANFVVFGPVFETESKREFGAPQGLNRLAEVTNELRGFPVVAIGGITLENAGACFEAGASGVAAIRLLNDAERMSSIVASLRSVYQ